VIHSDELLVVAKRIFCFGTPEEALEFQIRFLTYAMTYASNEDIEILKKYFSDDEFKLRWMTPHLGFRPKLLDKMESTLRPYPHFRHFRSDRFQA